MKLSVRGLCVLLVAGCGGPDFGPDKPATAQQQAVAEQAAESLTVFQSDTINADTIGSLPDSMFGIANSSYVPPSMRVLPHGVYADCATVTPGRVDFNCSINGTTLKGYVSRTVANGVATWQMDLSETAAQTSGTTMLSTSVHLGGTIKVTGGTQIDGSVSMDAAIHISDGAQNENVTVNAGIAYNHIVLDPTQHCATGGNIVVQVDAQAPNASVSQAVRYTFTGCQMVTVAVAQ